MASEVALQTEAHRDFCRYEYQYYLFVSFSAMENLTGRSRLVLYLIRGGRGASVIRPLIPFPIYPEKPTTKDQWERAMVKRLIGPRTL